MAVIALVAAALGLRAEPAAAPRPDHQVAAEQAFRRAVGHELRRLHRVQARLRQAVAHNCCNAPTPALAAIAACESGGRPWAVSPGGRYRGKYQFDLGTWRAVGGRGDPAAAPEPLQDYLAWVLFQRRGAQPWPVCGRGW